MLLLFLKENPLKESNEELSETPSGAAEGTASAEGANGASRLAGRTAPNES